MKALELFRKWSRGRTCTALEAWMAGYAAGCHHAYRKGQGAGRKVGERERGILLRALVDVYHRRPEVFERVRAQRANDVREDGYLLQKLLSDARRKGSVPDGMSRSAPAGDD